MDLPVPTPGATTTHHTVLAYLTYVSTYATSLEKSTVHGQVSESYFVSPVWRKCFSINKAVEPTAPSTTALPQSSVLIRTNLADPRTRVLDVPANPPAILYIKYTYTAACGSLGRPTAHVSSRPLRQQGPTPQEALAHGRRSSNANGQQGAGQPVHPPAARDRALATTMSAAYLPTDSGVFFSFFWRNRVF